jgi:uncharacterized membrane protein
MVESGFCFERLDERKELRWMAKVKKSISINAPVGKIYSYFEEPENLPEIWPSIIEVRDVVRSGGEVQRYRWVYKMAGMKFEGESRLIEQIPNQRTVTENKGGIDSTIVTSYQAEGEGTRVEMDVDYAIPGALLGKLAQPLILKMNEREAEAVLANLKTRMEA